MVKCTRKLIDAEAAKEAIEKLIEATQATRRLALEAGFREAALGAGYCYGALKEVLAALDALPDASEGRPVKYAKHVCDERCSGDDGHHTWPQQAGDGAEEV